MNFDARWKLVTETWGIRVRLVREEAAALYALLAAVQPRSMLEIGSAWGGSLALFAGACDPHAHIVSVDNGRELADLACTINRLKGEGHCCRLVRGNSHTLRVRGQVALAIGKPDVVHIDGDHREQGVLDDWQDYGGMARAPGGLIAFHDIVPRTPEWGVGRAWPQIRAQAAAYIELIGRPLPPSNQPAGIGVIWT